MTTRNRGRFATTEWGLVAAAVGSRTTAARHALAAICETYWSPVYCFIRSRGYGVDDAKDLTQGFFAAMLEHGYVSDARRERGRFRTFLLVCVKRYLADARDRECAAKRGGGRAPVPLDLATIAGEERLIVATLDMPDRIYEKRWALAVMERVAERLEHEAERSGSIERFRRLRPLLDGSGGGTYQRLADELGMSVGSLKVAVHRLRRRFGRLLRKEVARTVSDCEAVDSELRHLFEVLGS